MTAAKKSGRKMKKSGIAVFETYDFEVKFAPNRNREEYLREFLEQQGFEVNGVRLISGGEAASARRRPECRFWHEVYPNSSFWFYGCY